MSVSARPPSTPRYDRAQLQPSRTPQSTPTKSDSRRNNSTLRVERSLSRRLSSPTKFLKQFSFASTPQDDMATEFDRALSLLGITDLGDLEASFLKTEAFLRPWAYFRDAFLLLQTAAKPRATSPGQVSRSDILYWYTLFDEGQKRYEPLADPRSSIYTIDENRYWKLDTSWWGVYEHERFLYVWLLQSFKVGKVENPYGFEYLECLNICTAWDNVFRPIVEAVRNDYNHKGRYHYGRLARFVEEVAPSGLAFPEANRTNAHKPVHIAGFEPKRNRQTGTTDPITGVWQNIKEPVDQEGEELRRVYPQYGQLIERPKKNVLEWVREQLSQYQRERALRYLEGGFSWRGRGSRKRRGPLHGKTYIIDEQDPDVSPDKLRYELGNGLEKTPPSKLRALQRNDSNYSRESDSPTPSPRRRHVKRESSDGVYAMIRSSNPYTEHREHLFGSYTPRISQRAGEVKRSAAVSVNVRSSPHEQAFDSAERSDDHQTSVPKDSGGGIASRYPSYEGNGYVSSIRLPTVEEAKPPGTIKTAKMTRIPSPISIPENKTARKYQPILGNGIQQSDSSSTLTENAPPVPPRNPSRYKSVRGHVVNPKAALASHELKTLGRRIVSRENIRAHIGDLQRDESDNSLQPENRRISGNDGMKFAQMGGRGLNLGEAGTLQPYNGHMFPRQGSRPELTIRSPRRSYGSVASSEFFSLERSP